MRALLVDSATATSVSVLDTLGKIAVPLPPAARLTLPTPLPTDHLGRAPDTDQAPPRSALPHPLVAVRPKASLA